MKPKALVFAGSLRADSLNRKLARQAVEALVRAGIPTTFADLRDYPMPLYDGDLEAAQGLPPAAKAFKELVRAHDYLVIVSPEHNGSFPALVKNVIDWTSRGEPGEEFLAAFRGKSAALLSASPGPGGGRRGLKHLRELLEMLGVEVLPNQVAISKASQAFDAAGKLVRADDAEALERLLRDIAAARRPEAA